ncbi:sugar ABC transporter permease [Jeotgalibaca sp. MA1X17-3]|uniref:carbohydrate ABC transporter permease n=1 Tax=Jeotgalibaca sp. MA1X17-3 TaxID=2908211 RepID=UPI001F23E4C5|nr:sugar ABC transporter permease [Jeotgalibaca sp. MA1X17-3]UJF15630.1 sugar ABC transporter permease [Jeotgalibaca sp. MA1X17-3]
MKKSYQSYFWRQKMTPWLILLVPVIFTLWLKYYPILKAFYISFFDYDPINQPGNFVGLSNYQNMLHTQHYWQSWMNTAVFLLLQISMTFFIPIIQALFLNELTRFKGVLSTLYVLPILIPTTVNVIIWRWVWHPDYGIANQLMKLLGLGTQTWLSDPNLVKFCIIFPGVIGGGVGVLLYLSAIQGISTDIFESASLDGCTAWKKIWYIILPNIRFIIFIQLIIAVSASIQLLDAPYMFAAGGPSGASTTQGIYIYNTFNNDYNYGRGSAASVILMLVTLTVTAIQMRFENTEKG